MNTQNKVLNLNLDRFFFKIDCSKGHTKLLCSLNLFEIGIDNKLNFNLNIGKMVTGSLFNFGNNVATNFDIQINENLSSTEPYIEIIDPFNFKDYYYKVDNQSECYFSPSSNTKLKKENGNREKYLFLNSNEDILSFYTDQTSYFCEYEYKNSIKYYVSSTTIQCLLNGNLYNGPAVFFNYQNNKITSIVIYSVSYTNSANDKYDTINFIYDENNNLTQINYVLYNGTTETYTIERSLTNWIFTSSLSNKQITFIFDTSNDDVLSYCYDFINQNREKYTTHFIILDDYTIAQKEEKFELFHYDSSGNIDYECNYKGYFLTYESTKYKNEYFLSSKSNVLNVNEEYNNMPNLLSPLFDESGNFLWTLTSTNGNSTIVQTDNTLNDFLSNIFSNSGAKVSVSSILNTGILTKQVNNLNANSNYIFTTFFKVNGLSTIFKTLTFTFISYLNGVSGEQIVKTVLCPQIGDSLFKVISLDFTTAYDSVVVQISIPGNTNIEFYNLGVYEKSFGSKYYYDNQGILCKSIDGQKVLRIKTDYEKLIKFDNNNFFENTNLIEDENTYKKTVNINNLTSISQTYSKANGCLTKVTRSSNNGTIPILYNENYSYDSKRRLNGISSSLVPSINLEYFENTDLTKKEYSNHFCLENIYDFSTRSVNNKHYDNLNNASLKQTNKYLYNNKGLINKYQENSTLITQINYNSSNDLTTSYCSNLLYEGNSYQESSLVCENILKTKNINNFVYRYNYDADEKLTSILNSNNALIYGFTYDELDLLKSVTMNDNTKYQYSYDVNGRKTSESFINHAIHFTYCLDELINTDYIYKNSYYLTHILDKIDSNPAIIINNLVSELLDQPHYVGLFDSSIKLNNDNNPPISNKCLINNYYFESETLQYQYVYSSGNSVVIDETQNLKSLIITDKCPIYFEKNITAINHLYNGSIGFLYQAVPTSLGMNVIDISILSYNIVLYMDGNSALKLKVLKNNTSIYDSPLNHVTSPSSYDYININYSISSTKVIINFLSNKNSKNIEISSTLSLAENSIVRWTICKQNTIPPTDQTLKIAAVLADFNQNIEIRKVIKHFNTALKIHKLKLNYLTQAGIYDQYESSYYNFDSSFVWIPFKQCIKTSEGNLPVSYADKNLQIVSLKSTNENALYLYKNPLIYKTNLGSVGTLYFKSYLFDLDENQYYFTLKSSNFYLSLYINKQKELYFNCNGTTTLLETISNAINNEISILISYQIAQGICSLSYSINNKSLVSKTTSYLTGGVSPILNNFDLCIGTEKEERTILDINGNEIKENNASFNGLISNFIYKNSFVNTSLINKINSLVNPLKNVIYFDGLESINKKIIKNHNNHIFTQLYEYLSSNGNQSKFISSEKVKFNETDSNINRRFIYSYENSNNHSLDYKNLYKYCEDTLISNSSYNRLQHSYTYTSENYIQKEIISEGVVIRDDFTNELANKWEINYSYTNGDISSITYKDTSGATPITNTKTFVYSSSIPHQLVRYNDLNLVYDGLFLSQINFISGQPKVKFTYKGNELTEYYDVYINKRFLFTYNHLGQRVSKTNSNSGERINYFYNSNNLIMETHNNYILRYYYDSQNQVFAFDYCDSNNIVLNKYYYVRNALNDVIEIIDENKNTVVKYIYDAFGNECAVLDNSNINLSSKNPFKYRGYYYDAETQLFYCNSRYYSPELCRWISPDSIEYLDPESIDGLNLFCYCYNNPILYVDPSGHNALLIIGLLTGSFALGFGISVVGQGLSYGWDEINYLQAGIDGLIALGTTALSFTGIPAWGMALIGAGTGFGQYAMDCGFHNKQITLLGAGTATILGGIFGFIGGPGVRNSKAIIDDMVGLSDDGIRAIKAITKAANNRVANRISQRGIQATLNKYGKIAFNAVQDAIPGTIRHLMLKGIAPGIYLPIANAAVLGFLEYVYNKLGWC